MANANVESKLVVTNPDFDNIKTNLKNFLRSQSTFSDYDFEGSALSNLIDLLAYNTHYMAFYANMIANESFLDTASIRDSVVSHAKMLGYTPHSTTSAVAKMNLVFTDTSATTSLTLPKFTRFSSSALNGVNYIFSNLEEKTVTKSSNQFTFSDLNLTEGNPVNYVYTYNSTANPQSEFEIPDGLVDTSTLEVIVQTSSTNLTQTKFILSTDATLVDGDSKVYFLDETKSQKYKIYFGNGVVGKALDEGNVIILSYLISSGAAANKANNLTLIDSVSGLTSSNATITMIQAAAGGAVIEGIDNIKFAAPKSYISNNRAVTKNDYIALIQKNYPSLEAVNVWGGEENNPPVYGKIFVAAKPALGYELTITEKQYIIDGVIAPISILTVTPEFVDTDYIFLKLNCRVTYDPTATTKLPGQIESLARTTIYNYSNANLNSFNSYFKLSRLLRDIDNSDPSILSSQVDVTLEKRLEPILEATRNYYIRFNTELKRTTGRSRIKSDSSGFTMLDDNNNIRSMFFEEVPSAFTGIYSATIVNGGSNLLEAPTLVIGGDGLGATATATITNGKITAVTITNAGTGYSTATITAYDQDGVDLSSSITILPVIDSTIGKLQTYYYTDKQEKVVFNDYAGDINYATGEITLIEFAPIDINNDLKIIKFFAVPENTLFSSSRNSILSIDTEDTASVSITPIQVK